MGIKVDKEITTYLVENNTLEYNLHKASEELIELALVLNQKLLKPTKVKTQEIIDEIGDVEIRLKVLNKLFSKEAIQARVLEKETLYKKWIENKTYKQI